MLERLNQNAENLRTLHQALSDPKIKKATVSDPQYDEIKQETWNLMNMANHFVDSGVAPTREELQQYDEMLMKLDAKSARYLKEREANNDAELQKRIHAISNHREGLKNVFTDAAWIKEHVSEYPQGPTKEEQTAQKLQEFKALENDPKQLVNRMVEIRQNEMNGRHFPGKEAEDDALRQFFAYLIEPGENGQPDPERVQVLDSIAREMTRQRDGLSVQIGQEMEEREAQVLRGEIPGAELLAKEADAARDIGNELVIRLSATFGKRAAMDSMLSTIGLVLEGKKIGEEDAYVHFQNTMLDESESILTQREADAQAEGEKALKAKEETRLIERSQENACKAKDHGYEINLEHREMGDPYFKKIPEDVGKIQGMNDEQIREYQTAQNKSLSSIASFEAEVNEIAGQAKKKLEELNTLKIKDHDDSKYFKEMKSALEKVSKLNGKFSQEQIKKAVEDLHKASGKYYEERKGLFRSWKKIGRKRRIFAKEMRDISAVNFSRMEEPREGLNPKAPVQDQMKQLSRSINRGEVELHRRQEARDRQQEELRQQQIKQQEIDKNFKKLRESAELAAKKGLEELANKKGPYTPEEQFSIQKQLACLTVNEKLNQLEQAKQMDGIPKDKESYNKMVREVAGAKEFQNVLPENMNSDILKGMLQDPKTVGTILKECESSLAEREKMKQKENKKGKENEQGKDLNKNDKALEP